MPTGVWLARKTGNGALFRNLESRDNAGIPLGNIVDIFVTEHLYNDAHLLVLASSGAVVSELFDQILFLLPTDIGDHRHNAPAVHAMAGLADRFCLRFPRRNIRGAN